MEESSAFGGSPLVLLEVADIRLTLGLSLLKYWFRFYLSKTNVSLLKTFITTLVFSAISIASNWNRIIFVLTHVFEYLYLL
jgi:hypothetical protein